MVLISKERQIIVDKKYLNHWGYKLYGIRNDHTGRYMWVNSLIDSSHEVCDAMCGIGYGSYTIATIRHPKHIISFDGDSQTIEFAKKRFSHPTIHYHCLKANEISFDKNSFDRIVFFEAIEHLKDPIDVLARFHYCLKDNGLLILSTPNQNILPFDPAKHGPEHVGNFKPIELESLLNECGFKVNNWFNQQYKLSMTVNTGSHGLFMIAVCSKK